MADLVFTDKDASGKVTISVFREQASSAAAHFFDFSCSVPGDMVVVGGGGIGARTPQGALLTASYPSPDRSAWRVSSKDHRVSDPHRLTAFAIGMRISGLTRAQLLGHLEYGEETSGRAAHPEIAVSVPGGFELISGGFRVNWHPGAGNMATASFPEIGHRWRARSKDHIHSGPATITAFSIGLRKSLPAVGTVQRGENLAVSSSAAHPTARTLLDSTFALTGIGAEALTNGQGQLLWRVEPVLVEGRPGAVVGSKDHQRSSPGTVRAFALGVRVV
ncbi:hypothetical protein GCM10027160_09750 [Streptomyces calidiresistens]|uniref:Uncharacterized protein n=1 Tax=Streptomyces calidiresistens TaxID=1485586 RepID=A0A7W3T6A0_9ACTN|nr:hypothetical protein [Streptomyces calidiresistens]MBB0231526.1 hypothetical protein [Streptomyces calidiresistens]